MRHPRRTALTVVAATVAAGIAVLAAALTGGATAVAPSAAPTAAADARSLAEALGSLPEVSSQPAPKHLAKGLVPPTNTWFSGLVFGTTPQPVYPTPLAYTPTKSGFAINLPKVVATANTIFGSAAPDFGLNLHTSSMRVVRYDALTVTARYGSKADVTLAEGWPYVAVTARSTLTATLTRRVTATSTSGLFTTRVGGITYAVVAPAGSVHAARLTLAKGQRAVLFALPAHVARSTMVAGARGVVTGGSVATALHAKTVETELRYTTTGGKPTVLAALPYQQSGGAGCASGTIPSISGTLHVCTSTELDFSVARRTASDTLAVSALSSTDTASLRAALAKDIAATPAEPADSYGGGKWLYRLANLLQLARQTGDTRAAAALRSTLDSALEQWTQASGCGTRPIHCFVYDPVVKGVVGHEASYGSDQFNDHHFHYGYFLSAAAIAVADRPALKAKLAPVVNLLAADIASPTATSALPAHRTFDAYAGHSWAAGYAPFADGNDEESSSEAVNAWNGLTLWAKATGDTALANEGTWLLSTEIATARSDWLYPTLTSFPGFDHAFVSLNWGGKRDSATWFSADPAAKLAIQLIPMSPVSGYTKASAARMAANLKEAKSAHTGLFADYLLMYARVGGLSRASALQQLKAIPSASIDTANSRAYTMAWIMTR